MHLMTTLSDLPCPVLDEIAFMIAPLSAMYIMISSSFSTTFVFATNRKRELVIFVDAPQFEHITDLSFSAKVLSPWSKMHPVQMRRYLDDGSSFLIDRNYVSVRQSVDLLLSSMISRLNITCSSSTMSTSVTRVSIISMRGWNARAGHSAPGPPFSMHAI